MRLIITLHLLSINRIVFGLFFVMTLSGVMGQGQFVCGAVQHAGRLLALWFGESVPLTFVGADFGFQERVRDRES